MSAVHCVGVAVVVGLVGLAVFGERDGDALREARLDAIGACQGAVRDASINRQTAAVPYVEPIQSRDGWLLDWKRGSGLRLQNGFGAMVDATATCSYVDGRVVQLLVDDVMVIDAPAAIASSP